MSFVGNLVLFAAEEEFCKSKVIAMVRVAPFFDSRSSSSSSSSFSLMIS